MDLRHALFACALEVARLKLSEDGCALWVFAPSGDGLAIRSVLTPQRRFPDKDTRLRSLSHALCEDVRRLATQVCMAPSAIAVFLPSNNHTGTVEIAGPTGDAILMPFEQSCANLGAACRSVPRDMTLAGNLFCWAWTPERGSFN